MLLRVGTGESETAVGGDNDSVDIFTEIRTRKTTGSTVHPGSAGTGFTAQTAAPSPVYRAPGEKSASLPPAVQLIQFQQRAFAYQRELAQDTEPQQPKRHKPAPLEPVYSFRPPIPSAESSEAPQMRPALTDAPFSALAAPEGPRQKPTVGAELRQQTQLNRPRQYSQRDIALINAHAENARKGVVCFANLQRPATGYRPLQERLLSIESPSDYHEVTRQRRMEVLGSLSDKYMRQRVSVLRNWEQVLVEVHEDTPWRLHWPQDLADDQIMGEWLLAYSCRSTSFSVVDSAMMHVIEFHRGYLGVSPPKFEWSRWLLSKLELCMAKENPEGRRRRPGLDCNDVSLICQKIWDWVIDKFVPIDRRRFYVNCGAAISATFTPALRTGETCPGEEWNSRDYWSRRRLSVMLDGNRADITESVMIKAMKRKTVFRSTVARDKANLPIIYDAKSELIFSLARWGPKLQELDDCRINDEPETPAFRMGGPGSPALSVDVLRDFMRSVAEGVIEDWEIHDYGCHSLRIGREAMLRQSGARVETINDITTHTTTAGRQRYSRLEAVAALEAHRAADTATSQPVEKMRMTSAGFITVGADGTQLAPQSASDESVASSVRTSATAAVTTAAAFNKVFPKQSVKCGSCGGGHKTINCKRAGSTWCCYCGGGHKTINCKRAGSHSAVTAAAVTAAAVTAEEPLPPLPPGPKPQKQLTEWFAPKRKELQ